MSLIDKVIEAYYSVKFKIEDIYYSYKYKKIEDSIYDDAVATKKKVKRKKKKK